jgi:hypothetical protein
MTDTEKLAHPTVNMKIRGEVVPIDVKIMGIVRLLNLWPGIRTVASCQGRPSDPRWSEWTANVALCSDDHDWRTLAEFGFVALRPLIGCSVTVELMETNESGATLWLHFPFECIQIVENTLGDLLKGNQAGGPSPGARPREAL